MFGEQKGVITFVLGTRTHFEAKMMEKNRVSLFLFWAKTQVCMAADDTDTNTSLHSCVFGQNTHKYTQFCSKMRVGWEVYGEVGQENRLWLPYMDSSTFLMDQ